MKKDLHEKYVESVIARLKGVDVEVRSAGKGPASNYDGPPPVATLDTSMVANVRGFEISPLDNRVMLEVLDGERTLRIGGEGFAMLQKLAAEMITKCKLAEIVSQHFVEDALFDYRISAFRSNEWNSPTEFVLMQVEDAVQDCTFSFPLSGCRGNRAFIFCGVDFKPRSVLFEEFLSRFHAAEGVPDLQRLANQRTAEEWVDRYGTSMWASVHVSAEPNFAKQLALQHVTDATHLLRAFCVAGYHPTRHVGFVPGAPIFEPNLILASFGDTSAYFPDPSAKAELLWFSEGFLGDLHQLGLNSIDNLFRKESKTEMEDLCLRALLTLGSVAGMSDVSDKVVYGCTALDMLYTRDLEPILATMPKRLATEVGADLAERKKIVSVMKTVYGLRSGRVHAGRAAELNAQTLDFFRFLYYLATRLPFIAASHQTHAQYIESLEDRMLGAQTSATPPGRSKPGN